MTPAGPVPADAGPTEAQTLNFLGAMTGVGGYADMLGQYPQMPAEDVTVSEMLQGPPGPSLAENIREGEYLDATLQALGAVPLVGAAAKGARAAEGIRVYHGSGKTFDKFDASKIGTGEGAQAYGYGLYFAEDPIIARNYRDMLAPRKAPDPEGYARLLLDEYWQPGDDPDAFYEMWDMDVVDAKHDLRSGKITYEFRDGSFLQWDNKTQNYTDVGDVGGSIYEVNLKFDPENLLDWDAPLWEQSESVKRKLADAGIYDYENGEKYRKLREEVLTNQEEMNQYVNADKEIPESLLRRSSEISDELRKLEVQESKAPDKFDITGRGAYYLMGKDLSGLDALKKTTERVEALGIEGIRYRDANSRGLIPNSQRKSNYVVFDPEIIEIARRYGIALPLAGAILMGTMTPEEAVAAQAPQEMEDGGAVTKGIGALEASEDVDRVLGAMEFNKLPDRIQVAAEEVAEKTGLDKRMIAANMMVGDLEFASDVAPFFGPFYQSENIDPSVARLVPGNIPMETAQGRMKGFYVPEQMSDNELRQLQSRAQLYAFSPREGYFPEAQMERDTVYAVGPDASPEVWAHEFRHRMLSKGPREPMSSPDRRISRYQSFPPSQEGDNRLLDILYSNRPETYGSRSAAPYPQNALAAEAFLSGESPTGGPARSLLDSLVDAGMVNPNDLYPEFKDPTMFERMFGSEGPTRQDIKDRLREPENTARGRLAREKAKSNN
tara:strand:+ start:1 stop:2166 length:2166 start_codon:yes stop_codon:yes gene_type:complete